MTGTSLAIDGGTPVRSSMLPYAHQDISDADVASFVATRLVEKACSIPTIAIPRIARATIVSLRVLGALHATPEVKAALGDRLN